MGQVFGQDIIPPVVKASGTSLSLATTSGGLTTRITVGGQQYAPSSTIVLNTGTTGFNGLDTGSLAAGVIYNIFAVISAGALGLVISSSSAPTGFTSYKFLGKLISNSTPAISHVMNVGEPFIEYVSNSNTAGSSDTTSFAYGNLGNTFPNGGTGTNYAKRIRFLVAMKTSFDKITLDYSEDSGSTFYDSANDAGNVAVVGVQGATFFGVAIRAVNSTDLDINFQPGGRYGSNASYAGAGAAWSGLNGTQFLWRIVKVSGPVLIP